MNSRIKAGAALAFALSLLLSLMAPVVACADTSNEAPGWPRHLVTDMTPDGMTAFGNDNMSFLNCGNQTQAKSFQYIHEGVNASSLPTSGVGTASPPHEGVSCGGNQGLSTADGMFYTTHIAEDSAGYNTLTFVAMKNGRTLWSTDLDNQSDTVCSSMSGWGSEAHDEMMTNASQGSDGNIYGLVQQSNPGCATYLTGVSNVDGHVLFKRQLTTNDSQRGERVWVYNNKILTIDTTGLLRQFDYEGTENTSARYEFPASLGGFGGSYANADGRVFGVGGCIGSMTDTFIAYHDPNGDSYVGASGLGCNPSVSYTVGGNGSFVAYDAYDSATTFHFTTTAITKISITVPRPSSAYYSYNDGYWQDQSGNAITIRQFYTSGWASAGMAVDYIDGVTGAVSNVFSLGVDTDHPNPRVSRNDIVGGYLYSFICHNVSQCPSTASTSIDGWIHKISLPSTFGIVVKDTGQLAAYMSAKSSYVAMGDSYSGGEGNVPFAPGSNTSSDQCHRSAVAYPWSVANTALLNLKLTDFTACTGATVWLMENGQNDEPAQTAALNDDTSVVTLTIGGNDVHFIEYVEACTLICGPGTVPYNNIMAEINASSFYDSLKGLYGRILTAAPNADVYVADYPLLAPQGASSCAGFDLSGTYNVETALNSKIAATIDEIKATNARLHFVEVNYSGSPFEGHDLCSGDASYFNGIVLPPNQIYSVHPKVAGQSAYAAVFSTAIE